MQEQKKDLEIAKDEQKARDIAYQLTGQLGEVYQKYGKKTGDQITKGIVEYINDKMNYWKNWVKE